MDFFPLALSDFAYSLREYSPRQRARISPKKHCVSRYPTPKYSA